VVLLKPIILLNWCKIDSTLLLNIFLPLDLCVAYFKVISLQVCYLGSILKNINVCAVFTLTHLPEARDK